MIAAFSYSGPDIRLRGQTGRGLPEAPAHPSHPWTDPRYASGAPSDHLPSRSMSTWTYSEPWAAVVALCIDPPAAHATTIKLYGTEEWLLRSTTTRLLEEGG